MPGSPPLVLLHPFPLDAGFWTPLRGLLPDDLEVLAPDFPGLGHAPPEDGPTIDGVADRVAAAIRAMPHGRAVVCGLSMGGYVALSLAVRHRDAVAGLLLASTRADADDEAARAARDAGIARIRGGDLEGYLGELGPRLVAAGADPAVAQHVREMAARQSAAGIVRALEALRERPDRMRDLPRISVPAVVVWGEEDGVTPRSAARALASGISGARLQTIAGAGHLAALERPESFAAALGALRSGVRHSSR